jgi:hypothetical protein
MLNNFAIDLYGLETSIEKINGILSNLSETYVVDKKNFHDNFEHKAYELYEQLIPAIKQQARIETRMNLLIRLDL